MKAFFNHKPSLLICSQETYKIIDLLNSHTSAYGRIYFFLYSTIFQAYNVYSLAFYMSRI